VNFFLRLTRAFDAHPVRARVMVSAALLLVMLAGGLLMYRLFTQPGLGPVGSVPASVGLSIEPLDPRVTAGHGGSRGLFLDTEHSARGVPLLQALKDDRAIEVWEILGRGGGAHRPTGLYATLAYEAPSYAPDCVIEEWGISSRAVRPPKHGLALRYAARPRTRGVAALAAVVKLLPNHRFDPRAPDKRFFPVAHWSDGSRGVARVAPGKSARVLFSAEAADGAEAAGAGPVSGVRAAELRAYARVSIGRTSKLIESSNALYAVWVDEGAMVSADDGIRDPVENLRSLAYQPRALPKDNGDAPPAAAAAPPAERTPAAVPSPAYVLQLGAFREEAHARRLARRLTNAGFGCAVTRVETADGKTFFRVRLTPAMSKRDAEMLRAKFAETISGLQPVVMPEDR
jgi:cell division septation protein DedD